jgi:hypothetical protein
VLPIKQKVLSSHSSSGKKILKKNSVVKNSRYTREEKKENGFSNQCSTMLTNSMTLKAAWIMGNIN